MTAWQCEVSFYPNYSLYEKEGCRVLEERGRATDFQLACYVRHPNASPSQRTLLGHFQTTPEFVSLLPADTPLQRLLPEDFTNFFRFAGKSPVYRAAAPSTSHAYDASETQECLFGYDAESLKNIRRFYVHWNPFVAANLKAVPSPLELCLRYAGGNPPPRFDDTSDWRGLGLTPPIPREVVTVVSENASSRIQGPKRFVAVSAAHLSRRIVDRMEGDCPATFSEIFRANLHVTCVPFDLDITGQQWCDHCHPERLIDRCVDELLGRVESQFRRFLETAEVGGKLHVYRGNCKSDKFSLHLYLRLPPNWRFESIDHVAYFVRDLVGQIERERIRAGRSSTLLGHWEGNGVDDAYQTSYADEHAYPAGQEKPRGPRARLRFVSYLDAAIYRNNGSLRLPGCVSRAGDPVNLALKHRDDSRKICPQDILDALAHFPPRPDSFRLIRCAPLGPPKELPLEQGEDWEFLQGLVRAQINRGLVTRRKVTRYAVFWDTDEFFCPRVKRRHSKAKQYFVFDRLRRTLKRRCWSAKCRGNSAALITTLPPPPLRPRTA